MSTFDDASLVMIPSGYKTSKVYSVKPTDGSGDLSFSRSNDTATRVNSAGLIEKVRTNLLTYSNNFSSGYSNFNSTTSASTTPSPDGTTNAARLVALTSGVIFRGVTASGIHTFSVFAKYVNQSNIRLGFTDVLDYETTFNIQNGTIIASGATLVSTIENYGNGWYRCSISRTLTGPTPNVYFGATILAGDFDFYGAQLETGDIATDYIATTSAAVSVGPVANVPRLDYLNSSCPRLLLEPQRTNSQINSENFAAWLGINNVTIGSNTTDTLDPAGYNGADKITIGSGSPLRIYEFTGSSAGTGTISLFVKAGTSTSIALFTSSGSLYVDFNISTQVIIPTTGTGTITNYGNGWYRITATATLSSNEVLQILFNGSNGQTIYIWGAQCEAGAYATSYIPTLGAAVTRGADACSKTGISSLIGQTEGVLYIECNIKAVSELSRLLFVSDGTLNNFINIYIDSDNKIYATTRLSASTVSLFASSTLTAGTYKIAYAYKANDFILYINGTAVSGSSSANIPATSRLEIGSRLTSSSYFNSFVNQAILFPTRLSNADLAALTA